MAYIKITLHSDMCAGSGESEGNSIDTDICTDAFGIPYIPGRRIKGCLKQAADDLKQMGHPLAQNQEVVRKLFGDASGSESAFTIGNAYISGINSLNSYLREKGNNDLPESVKNAVNVAKLFTSVRGQTRLENGVKVENTLRSTRVLNHYDPLAPENAKEMELYAKLYLESADRDVKELLELCCMATRHMGSNRNRGMGNVEFTLVWTDSVTKDKNKPKKMNTDGLGKTVRISYQVVLEAPLTLVGCDELNTMITARNVIGCMAGHYLKSGKAEDENFRNLFLNGKVKWSDLTPVIDGTVSAASPLFLMKLKNGGGKLINRLAEEGDDWKKQKPKTLDGSYAALIKTCNGFEYHIASVEIHSIYHNSVTRKQLYMQDYIDAGLIYGGTVEVPVSLAPLVYKMLQEANLQFGRSKRAQYASCRLLEIPKYETVKESKLEIPEGEAVIVVLKSDLVCDDGCYRTNNEFIRAWIAEKLGVKNEKPQGCEDYCLYHTIGGFQTQWQLQKPHIPAVRGGSVFCFVSNGEAIPENLTIGEYQQEGFGYLAVYSLEKIKKIHKAAKADIAVETVAKADVEDVVKRFRSLLLVQAATEEVKKFAREFDIDEKIPIGRLRLMLQEATNLADLRERVNTMRLSDISVEEQKGKRARSKELLDQLYGKNVYDQIAEREKELFRAVENDTMARKLMEQNWKLALQIVLHRAHYNKGDK